MVRYKLASLLALVVALFVSPSAMALTTITSPFTSALVAIGAAGATQGAMVACFEEQGGGNGFRMEHLGFEDGLQDDFRIVGGSGTDTVIFVQSTTTSYCGLTLSPLKYNGHYLDVDTEGGNDLIFGAQGDTYYYGGTGNDLLFHYSSIGRSYGEGNNDHVLSFASGSSDRIYGQSGSDCLYDSNAQFATFDCGSGTDEYSNSPKPSGTVSCENQTSCCGLCF